LSDKEVGEFLIQKFVLVHLTSNVAKFDLLVFMIQKLYMLVSGEISEDNPDSPQNQEILLGGQLFLMVFKEKLQEWLNSLKYIIMKDINNGDTNVTDSLYFKKVFFSIERHYIGL